VAAFTGLKNAIQRQKKTGKAITKASLQADIDAASPAGKAKAKAAAAAAVKKEAGRKVANKKALRTINPSSKKKRSLGTVKPKKAKGRSRASGVGVQ
jgi:hypothetical protein